MTFPSLSDTGATHALRTAAISLLKVTGWLKMQDMKMTDQKWNAKSILSLFCLKRSPLVCSFVSCYFIPAFSCLAISCPAISCPAKWSVNFTSVIFTSSIFSAPKVTTTLLPRDATQSALCHSMSSVCLSVRDVQVPWSHRLEYFENNFAAD